MTTERKNNHDSYIPSLEFVHQRIGELSRELQLLKSLRRALERYHEDSEAAKEIRAIQKQMSCQDSGRITDERR